MPCGAKSGRNEEWRTRNGQRGTYLSPADEIRGGTRLLVRSPWEGRRGFACGRSRRDGQPFLRRQRRRRRGTAQQTLHVWSAVLCIEPVRRMVHKPPGGPRAGATPAKEYQRHAAAPQPPQPQTPRASQQRPSVTRARKAAFFPHRAAQEQPSSRAQRAQNKLDSPKDHRWLTQATAWNFHAFTPQWNGGQGG